MKIAVAGTGYVGLSLAVLLSQKHEVTAVDIVPEKVRMINRRVSPIQDEEIKRFFEEKELHLTATTDSAEAYASAEYVAAFSAKAPVWVKQSNTRLPRASRATAARLYF